VEGRGIGKGGRGKGRGKGKGRGTGRGRGSEGKANHVGFGGREELDGGVRVTDIDITIHKGFGIAAKVEQAALGNRRTHIGTRVVAAFVECVRRLSHSWKLPISK